MTQSVDVWTTKLKELQNEASDNQDVAETVNKIAAVIKRELCGSGVDDVAPNQVVLNIAVRCYYQVLHKHNLPDTHFAEVSTRTETFEQEQQLQILYAVLQTVGCAEPSVLHVRCLAAYENAVALNNNAILLLLLKILNLLSKKYAKNRFELRLQLEHIYHCLQSGQVGMRDEVLTLFSNACKQSPQQAFEHFQFIMEFWPWTNRNKYYLLGCILSTQRLPDLLAHTAHTAADFYAGLRLSLSYKRLLAASQHLVKALSQQSASELLDLSAELLTSGSCAELHSFYTQWFARIAQKDQLFVLLQRMPVIERFLADSASCSDTAENYRLVLIFSMFSRQIFAASKLHFFKISTELITNCYQFDMDAQMLVYNFIVDNMASFAIEDCLEFILAFVQRHRGVDSAQHRNGILGQISTIINYVAKTYSRLHASVCSTLEASIVTFFQQLQSLIELDMASAVYQPKIFALKLCELLLTSLYADKLKSNAKNCMMAQNRKLGLFLIERKVFVASQMSTLLLQHLDDPFGFDDALELIVALLVQLPATESAAKSMELCMACCQRGEVDACALSALYAKVALQEPADIPVLLQFACEAMEQSMSAFAEDPLLLAKRQHHLFGYLNVLNEVVLKAPLQVHTKFGELIELVSSLLGLILDKLQLARQRADKQTTAAADFQDMEESLQLLVQESSWSDEKSEWRDEDSAAGSRKFLLMSFWLTLRAGCDLASSIGCALAAGAQECADDCAILQRCLQLHVALLTRCRHKGAIEAAGLSIGKLTKCITTEAAMNSKPYVLLYDCLSLLFAEGRHISTSRRGAGFSIMLLHIVRNDAQRQRRPLLKRAMASIFEKVQATPTANGEQELSIGNCDRLEVLMLHYLCVLVKDTELRDALTPYYSEIMTAAITQIDHADWAVCNAALQLIGALIPKVVGQTQAQAYDTPSGWEASEVTYSEVLRKLPSACDYILDYCAGEASTRSIILFLGLLTHVEHLRKSGAEATQLLRFRELMWELLRHRCEKVRQLAALCFVRAHEFRCDLPHMLLAVVRMLFQVRDENFFEGLLFALNAGVSKLRHESRHAVSAETLEHLLQELRTQLEECFVLPPTFKLYTLRQLFDLLRQVGCDEQSDALVAMRAVQSGMAGRDLWHAKLADV